MVVVKDGINILSCFSGNDDCFNNDIAKYEDDIIYNILIKLVIIFLLLYSEYHQSFLKQSQTNYLLIRYVNIIVY